MNTHNQKNSIKKLVGLIGIASTSIFLSFPALALINSNSSSFERSPNNSTRRIESSGRNIELLAQGTSGTSPTGTSGTGTTGTGAGGVGTGGVGTNQNGVNQPGAAGVGTNQNGVNQPGAAGVGTNQNSAGGAASNNQQYNGRQDAFTQSMLAGYAATNQRDYPTALTYFERALQMRPNNPYARRAVTNVRGYIQRDAQGGSTAIPTNQGNR